MSKLCGVHNFKYARLGVYVCVCIVCPNALTHACTRVDLAWIFHIIPVARLTWRGLRRSALGMCRECAACYNLVWHRGFLTSNPIRYDAKSTQHTELPSDYTNVHISCANWPNRVFAIVIIAVVSTSFARSRLQHIKNELQFSINHLWCGPDVCGANARVRRSSTSRWFTAI